ncbi:DEAD/DEAH box helicase family protein [Salinibius halmophilus]|uniref:DEAD/DEAH box helicase family protein n=1 Tax=Salinibius halmophilus TaxID=1853216 RepID=UPI000E666689|nr:DEAD/DEAH box helicase family protein [Salinibius halmophilus]
MTEASITRADRMRQKVRKVLNGNGMHEHQREAARKTFEAFDSETRAVVLAAEMQAGKSGISLALACNQRLSLSDIAIEDKAQLKDTLYMLTMVDTALLKQAEDDLKDARNAVVTNFNRFERDIESNFKGVPPKLIIIDECHYGSNITAVRYNRVFDYLEEHTDCKVIFISATPFGALYAAEQAFEEASDFAESAEAIGDLKIAAKAKALAENAAKNSILRRAFGTKLVFHRTSNEYFGVREMLNNGMVKPLVDEERNFANPSGARDLFMKKFHEHEGDGWSLVRVPAGTVMDAKSFFISQGVDEDNIFIIGKSLQGIPKDDQTEIERFKREYENAEGFDEKFIAITVAGCRAGINFGGMKNTLISTWDSTVASVAAVVQANIGRGCGYHSNDTALHFTNLPATQAYAESLDYLENNTNEHGASDFDGLREFFDSLCDEYNVQGLDVGLTVKHKKRRPIGDVETYKTGEFVALPLQLLEAEPDYEQYTSNSDFLRAIHLIREEYLRDAGPRPKGHRAMRGSKKNWVKAQWVNGDSYDNPEKAGRLGTMKDRTVKFIEQLKAGEEVEYNHIVAPGNGEASADKTVTATIFSRYNLSRRKVDKKQMDDEDLQEIAKLLNVPYDDTIVVLYAQGEFDNKQTQIKINLNKLPDSESIINDESQFTGFPDVTFDDE